MKYHEMGMKVAFACSLACLPKSCKTELASLLIDKPLYEVYLAIGQFGYLQQEKS